MKSVETDTQNTPRSTPLVWYFIILPQSYLFYCKNMNRLWAKVIEKALQMYAGHRQQHDLASESEHVFSNHISLKK